MGPLVFAIIWSVFIFSVVYLVIDYVQSASERENRQLKSRVEGLLLRESTIERKSTYSNIFHINQVLKRGRFSQGLFQLLLMSGWNVPVSVFILGVLLFGGMIFALSNLILGNTTLSLLLALLIVSIPYWILILNKRRYIQKFTLVFPDSILLMKNAIKAGHGIQAAFQMLAKEGPHPVALEFKRVVHEIELGSHLTEALGELYKRIPTIDLRIFVLGVFIQNEVGGNLVELFDHIEKTIRDRIVMAGEIRVLSAQGRMSGLVLMLLPFVLIGVLLVVTPGYFDPMLESEVGKKILMIALAAMLIGAYIIRRMTNFKI